MTPTDHARGQVGEAKGDGRRNKIYFVPMNYTNLTAQERLNYESVRVDLRFAQHRPLG